MPEERTAIGSMVRAAPANFERYNGTTIMSATASAGSKRSPRSWRAFWPQPSLTATRFRWPGRRALLVVIVMAGLGLGSPGVSVPHAAGASDAVRAQLAEAAAVKAEANLLSLQYRGNPQGLREAGR